MDIFSSIILGIVEGITEFLPISSTGHLILVSKLLKIEQTEFLKSFEIIIQLGAILAVVALYWRKLLTNRSVIKRVLVGFLPTAVIGLILYKFIKLYLLGNIWVVIISLFLGGIVIIFFELWFKKKETDLLLRGEGPQLSKVEDIPYWQAVIIGLCQSLAVIPGVSRSAATIVGGLVLGLKRDTVIEFSFLLAVPIMLAATGLDLIKSSFVFSSSDWGFLTIGFMVSFLVALLAIKSFLKYIRHHNFMVFGFYRLAVAVIFILFFL